MSTEAQGRPYYSSMPNSDDHLFSDEQIQRYDADTIQRRYGEHWRNYASNVREITQADGSIVKGKYFVFLLLTLCQANECFSLSLSSR